MTERDPLPVGHEEISKSSPFVVFTLSMAGLLAVLAIGLWIVTIFNTQVEKTDPLVIISCTVESFEEDNIGVLGSQGDCEPPADGPQDIFLVGETPESAGVVCNNDDELHTYLVRLEWWSMDTPGVSFVALEVPFDFAPGCEPYRYVNETPEALLAAVNPNPSLGKWRIVGTATPVDNDKIATYQWVSVETFTLMPGASE